MMSSSQMIFQMKFQKKMTARMITPLNLLTTHARETKTHGSVSQQSSSARQRCAPLTSTCNAWTKISYTTVCITFLTALNTYS